MLTYKNILVPTDFSTNASAAIEHAVVLAKERNGRVHLLHVLETSLFGPTYIPQGGFVYPKNQDEVFNRLEDIKERHPDVSFESKAVIGVAADEIVTYADDNDIDLICISTNGRRGLSRMLLGSTTEAVVRRASCPVLSMHGTKEESEEPVAAEASEKPAEATKR